ncbi:MAG: protein-L-isoaspartate O-methyltransferase [Chromatiales bacterium]|jgi:protein-L-isoaspartate(D-aspartate) O-methyltransferase
MTADAYATARFNMVEQQVRPWEVMDSRVLTVMEELPRELFVDEEYKGLAYADIEVPLGHGQYMLKPTLTGRLLQALNIKASDKILEIGTGSGYLTACLAKLGKQVTSIEIHEDIAAKAADALAKLDLHNIRLIVGDAMHQIPSNAPFDVIAVTGSIPDCQDILPKELEDGGRLFMITGEAPVMTAQLVTRISGDIFKTENLFETEVTALDNSPQKPAFSF